MKPITIAFDTNGTLVHNAIPNKGLIETLKNLHSMLNTRIIVWSAGGKEVAEYTVKAFQLEEYVSACYEKGKCDESVDIAFDDQDQEGREVPIAKHYIYIKKD